MAIEIYPTTPAPSYVYILTARHRTLVSEFGSSIQAGELRQRVVRFPKRGFEAIYRNNLRAERDTVQNFFTKRGGMLDAFWFVDFKLRNWVDEYVGRGGPLPILGAIADDGGVQTDETIKANDVTANDMILLPAVPAVNDAYYFGFLTQNDKLTVTIGTQGAGTWTIAWEYWTGSAWVALSGVTDGTTGFKAAAGDRDMTFTVPNNWAITAVKKINAYWIRARVSAYTSVSAQPKGTKAVVNSKTYELHGKSSTGVKVYVDDVEKTAGGVDYTFISGGGAGGVDRIVFNSYPAVGSLITSDFEGYLRIKARFGADELKEEIISISTSGDIYNYDVMIGESQW